MKALFSLILGAAMLLVQAPAQAQQRVYDQAELDALLAPVALYPDPLLSQVLMASTYPADVAEAAAWLLANPHLRGEEAVHAAQHEPWDPSVKSLLAFPDVLARMDESPRWMMDLGQAFLAQEAQVMNTIQSLRRRAQAAGHLQSNEHYAVQEQGPLIALVPVQPHVVYVPYYSPYVVYGPWWWHHYRPVVWRPWRPAPVFVSANFFFGAVDWQHRHVRIVHRPTYVHRTHTHVVPGRWQHDRSRHRADFTTHIQQRAPEANRRQTVQSAPAPARIESARRGSAPREARVEATRRDSHQRSRSERHDAGVRPYARIPESRRQPIVQSTPITARPVERRPEAAPRPPHNSHVQAQHPRREAREHPRHDRPREVHRAEKEKKQHPRQGHGNDRHG